MDVSPAKRSYFTCANVWWKLLFHSTHKKWFSVQKVFPEKELLQLKNEVCGGALNGYILLAVDLI